MGEDLPISEGAKKNRRTATQMLRSAGHPCHPPSRVLEITQVRKSNRRTFPIDSA